MSELNNQKIITESVVAEAADEERGSIDTMKKLSDWVDDSNKNLRKWLDARDVRQARLFIIELAGTLEQLKEHAGLLSKDVGLPNMKM